MVKIIFSGYGRFENIWSKWTHFIGLYQALLHEHSIKRIYRHCKWMESPSAFTKQKQHAIWCAWHCVLPNPPLRHCKSHDQYWHCNNRRIYWYYQRCTLWFSLVSLVNLQSCNFIKKTLQHRCFLVNITRFLRTASFKERLWWLFLKLLLQMKIKRCNVQRIASNKNRVDSEECQMTEQHFLTFIYTALENILRKACKRKTNCSK